MIQKELDKVNFFGLQDSYYKEVTDLPTTYITYYEGEQKKEVMDYYGAPEKLKKLEEFIQKTVFAYLD